MKSVGEGDDRVWTLSFNKASRGSRGAFECGEQSMEIKEPGGELASKIGGSAPSRATLGPLLARA